MTAIKTAINAEVKLNLAIEALKNPELKNKELADKFGVSETTARRAKKEFVEEAARKIAEELAAKEVSTPKRPRTARTRATDTQARPVRPTKSATDTRGFRPRNGRWVMLNEMFSELGFDKPSKELWEEANRRSKAQGLTELNRGSFYAMLSVAKKNAQTKDAA